MSKLAILQVADQGPLESIVVMLRAVGYDCVTCSPDLQRELKRIGCDTVLDHRDLTRQLGYDAPMPLPEASISDMSCSDVLFVDVKAHRNYPKVIQRWPLANRVLWYRINGGKPEHVVRQCDNCCKKQETATTYRIRCPRCEDFGDEVNPPCPVLTPNQWYRDEVAVPQQDIMYCCWPPFLRWHDYQAPRLVTDAQYKGLPMPPICLVHGNWGYAQLHEPMARLGVRMYGQCQPQGVVRHAEIPVMLNRALAYVHLKSSDAPGYSLYEALASACPVICSRRLVWKCRMQDLFVENETCLMFDREGHQGLTDEDVVQCTEEVSRHLEALRDPAFNRKIGESGRNRLREIMWSETREGDVESLRNFMARNFRCGKS